MAFFDGVGAHSHKMTYVEAESHVGLIIHLLYVFTEKSAAYGC